MGAKHGEADASRAMLRKLSKQQHFLLRELERTKRCLHEEIWSREENASAGVTPTKSELRAWPHHPTFDHAKSSKENTRSPSRPVKSSKHSPVRTAVRNGSGTGGISCLKRSRSEAEMSSVEREAEGTAMATTEEVVRPAATTRIDMLGVMSSTGEAALELGLSKFPVGRGWTAQPRTGKCGEAVHMLPVFRLPEVSKYPAGGFLRRLPREETQRERECRLREAEELANMKKALGLTDRDLEALEQEILPGTRKGGGLGATTSSRALQNSGSDVLDLEKGTHELLYGSEDPGKRNNSFFSADGKRRRRLLPGPAGERQCERQGIKHREIRRGGRRIEAKLGDNSSPPAIHDVNNGCLDRPTPRVLRRTAHSTLAAELAASTAFSVRCSGARPRTSGNWDFASGVGQGVTAGSILGTTSTTEKLVAAAADVGMVNLMELRRELGRSVGQVRYLANAVKADVQEVTRMCPVQHPRAVKFLRRWACERLAALADEVLLSRAAVCLERWRRACTAMAMAERKQAYLRYQGSSKLSFALDKAYLRRLAKGWIRWSSVVDFERAEERRALEISATITIQRVVRGLAARRLRAWLAAAAHDKQRHLAAVAITRHAKGKVARMRYGRLQADVERLRAAEVLKRVARGMLGRKKAQRLREKLARLKVALSLQTLYRGRAGRRFFLAAKRARRERLAATRIQAIARGAWGRQWARRLSREIREDAAAGRMIQAARAWLARRLVRKLRDEEERSRTIRSKAALNLQRVYRGHRSRILHGARLEIKRSLQREEDAAATKIQALVRAHLSKRVVSSLFRKRKERRISDAHLWMETWSEDAQAWFYYNSQTGEALWQPPSTGYTKHDGKLVLASGEVLADPLQGLTEEERSEAKKASSCVECEDKRSTKKCDQCGDGYCTKCFRKTHASGRRTKHTWTHVGPMECAECEAEVAIKWCTACDDPFCGPCWSAIHSRGKRSQHSHCNISPGGRVSAKATAPDGSDAGPFTPGDSLIAETAGGAGYTDAMVEHGYGDAMVEAPVETGTAQEWQEFADDNGYPYWYNPGTGVSQYENPYDQQGAWASGSLTTATSTVTQDTTAAGAWDGQTWDEGNQGELAYAADVNAGAMVAADGSSTEWSEHLDDEGYTYYYSSLTEESQYECPY